MRRYISILITICMLFSCAACSKKADDIATTPIVQVSSDEYVPELLCTRQHQRLYAQPIDGSDPRLIKDCYCNSFDRSGDIVIAYFDDGGVYKINLRKNTEDKLFNVEEGIAQISIYQDGFVYLVYNMETGSFVYKYDFKTKKSTKLFADMSLYDFEPVGNTLVFLSNREVEGEWSPYIVGYDLEKCNELWTSKVESVNSIINYQDQIYFIESGEGGEWQALNLEDGSCSPSDAIGLINQPRSNIIFLGSNASLYEQYEMSPELEFGHWSAFILQDGISSYVDMNMGEGSFIYCTDSDGDFALIRAYNSKVEKVFDEDLYTSEEEFYLFNGSDGSVVKLEGKDEIQKMFADGAFPVFDCSTARKPVVSAIYDLFCLQSGNEGAAPVCNTTHLAWLAIANGTSDIALLAAPTEEEEAYLKEKNVEVDMKLYGGDGLVFIANKACGVSDLSFDDIKGIYRGEITNWSQLGGADHEIEVYYRDDQSGSQRLFERLVWGNKDIPDFSSLGFVQSDFMSDIVWDCVNNPYAVGYSIMTYLSDVFAEESLQCFSVNGVTASTENVQNGSYPFSTRGYVVIRSDEEEKSGARRLYDWFGSNISDEILIQNGIVPLHE